MHLYPAVALSLLLSAVPAYAQSTGALHPSRPYNTIASGILSADDLNAMVLSILSGQPQPALSGSGVRQQQMQAAWTHLRGLLGDQS